MSLFQNRSAPVTFRFGFVEAPFSVLCDALQNWFQTIDTKHAVRTAFHAMTAQLEEAVLSLEPLTTPPDRYLLVETTSNWTAIFANGLRGNDVASAVGYLPRILNRIRDRFTPEMLERYCRALGIELSNANFYGLRSCAVRTTGQKQRGDLSMSISEANADLDL